MLDPSKLLAANELLPDGQEYNLYDLQDNYGQEFELLLSQNYTLAHGLGAKRRLGLPVADEDESDDADIEEVSLRIDRSISRSPPLDTNGSASGASPTTCDKVSV